MQLVIAEKPSVARSIAEVIGASEISDGYMEGNGYIVSWCVVLSVKLDAPVPCRLDAPDLGFACRVSADCLHQHLQVI